MHWKNHSLLAIFMFFTLSSHAAQKEVDTAEVATAILHCAEQMNSLLEQGNTFIDSVYATEAKSDIATVIMYNFYVHTNDRSLFLLPDLYWKKVVVTKTIRTPSVGTQPTTILWDCFVKDR